MWAFSRNPAGTCFLSTLMGTSTANLSYGLSEHPSLPWKSASPASISLCSWCVHGTFRLESANLHLRCKVNARRGCQEVAGTTLCPPIGWKLYSFLYMINHETVPSGTVTEAVGG